MNLMNPCLELRRESWLSSGAEGPEELADSFATGRPGTEWRGPDPRFHQEAQAAGRELSVALALTGSRDVVS